MEPRHVAQRQAMGHSILHMLAMCPTDVHDGVGEANAAYSDSCRTSLVHSA